MKLSQESEPDEEYFPLGQALQSFTESWASEFEASSLINVPFGQFVHTELPDVEYLP